MTRECCVKADVAGGVAPDADAVNDAKEAIKNDVKKMIEIFSKA